MKNEFEKYADMSPFEVKNELIEIAYAEAKKANKTALNAGRGNPNFLNTTVRFGFNLFSDFATKVSDDMDPKKDLGYRPEKKGLYKKFEKFIQENKDRKGSEFLKDAIDYSIKHFAQDNDDFMFELTDAALGDFYPMPPRIFPRVEKIVKAYIAKTLNLDNKLLENYDLFATEGATAAMIYLFDSLKVNKILKKGDSIAIITPIFSPYLEIPVLSEFNFVEVFIQGSEENDWQLPEDQLEKLKDPNIKALYMVNPTNPTSVALNDKCIKKLADLVKNHRKDLIILTDVVYAPFVDNFNSILNEIPENTICVYSYSKYFGVTGWRLGVVLLDQNNIIDEKIKNLPDVEKKMLHERYKTLVPEPEKLKFIDRLEADSRKEALAHTGGLSCPQQCIMTLFSLFSLIDDTKDYKKIIHEILKVRIENFYNNLEEKVPPEKDHTYYYVLLDMAHLAKKRYGEEFSNYLYENVHLLEFLFKLAKERHIICLPGEGFAGPKWSLRVSLANLNDEDYIVIGKNIKELLNEYYEDWKAKK
jgi:aspartate 4-decarboxylase